MRLFVGGSNGLHLYEDGDLTELSTEEVLCLIRHAPGKVIAGTVTGAILKWEGNGTKILIKDVGDEVTSLAAAADGTLFAGCSPAGAFVSRDGGETWSELNNFTSAPGSEEWDAPFGDPLTSAISGHPKNARTLYFGVEVGGIYRTRDAGKKFFDLGIPGPDIHSIEISPAKHDRVYVATGGGAYCTDDGGFSWKAMGTGNRNKYTMGLAAHPVEADRVIISATPSPPPGWRGKNGARCDVYLSTDCGRRFRTVVKDLRGAVQRNALVINPKVPSEVAFGTSAGEIHYSNDGGESFYREAERLGEVRALAFT